MNNSAKRILTVALIAILAVFALSFIACNNGGDPIIGGNTVTEIYIEKSDMPRQLYVQGQALELQGGVLTTVIDGSPAPIPLTSEGITVSGYDPNTVGNQTVTVTYKEKTTTYPVTVIARASAEGYEANYFVGDAFNKAKGKLRLAKDNAETFVVNMSDPSVTVTSFDSSASGEKTVTVNYVKDGVSYDCSFKVTFHEAAEIKFVAPKKLVYTNSDTELNLSGGYLTVKAGAPSNLTKNVTLTQSMVSGYDPSALTLENRYEPVQQTITVSYAGRTWTYTVRVSFSGLSVIGALANELSDLDWSKEELPTLTDDQKLYAIDAMETYLDLAPADQELVSEEDLAAVIKAATVAAQELYAVELNKLAGAFMLDFNSGALLMLGNTYEDIEKAAEELDDPDAGFNRYSAILRAIKTAYPTMQLNSKIYITNYIVTHAEAANETIVPMLEHMMKVYNTMKDIPEEWDLDTLKEYEMDILDTVNTILLSDYKGNNFMALYNPITNWRADFFEIIYTYYYEVKEGGKQDIQNKLWGVVPAPGLVYDWYNTFMSAYNEVYIIAQNTESGKSVLYDTSKFFHYYNAMYAIAAQIKNGEGTPMDAGIYELLNGDTLMEYYIRRASTGYLGLMSGALKDEKVAELWELYLPIYAKYLNVTNNEQYTAFLADNKADMQIMFEKLIAMTPSQVHSFLSSLNYLYEDTRGALPLFDYSTNGATSVFVACVVSTCMSSTPESTRAMLQNMFLATEYYSLRNYNTKAMENFIAAMDAIIAAEGVSEEDKTAFYAAVGIQNWYDKYKAIYDAVKDQSTLTVDEIISAKLDELNSWLDKYDEILTVISTTDTSTEAGKITVNYAYPLLFAIYDKIDALKSELMQMEGYEFAFIAKEYTIGEGEEAVTFTIDSRCYSAKVLTVRLMLANAMENKLVWDIHTDDLAALYAQIVDVMYAEFKGIAYEGDMSYIMDLFRNNTSAETKYAFFQLQGTQLLYGAIEKYLTANLPAELVETGVVKNMLDAEIYYWVYMNDSENYEALKTFRENMVAVMDLYNGLDNPAEFDAVMSDMYSFYEAEYQRLLSVEIPETPEDDNVEAA